MLFKKIRSISLQVKFKTGMPVFLPGEDLLYRLLQT